MNIKAVLDNEISEIELLHYYGANITNIRLPKYINAFVFTYKNIYNIYLNKSLCEEKKKKALLHELAHIELDHTYKRKNLLEFNIAGLEDEADRYIEKIKENVWKKKTKLLK